MVGLLTEVEVNPVDASKRGVVQCWSWAFGSSGKTRGSGQIRRGHSAHGGELGQRESLREMDSRNLLKPIELNS